MARLVLIGLLLALTAGPALSQRREIVRPPELPFIIPEPLPLEEIPAALDEASVSFHQVHRLTFQLVDAEVVPQIYLARQDDPENDREKLVWVVRHWTQEFLQTERYDAVEKAWRFGPIRTRLDSDQRASFEQMRFYRRSGPIWDMTAFPRIEDELPGAEIFCQGIQLDDVSEDVDYRLYYDVRHEGELKRIVFAGRGDQAVVESIGPAPKDYLVDPWASESPTIMTDDLIDADPSSDTDEASPD